MIVKINGDSLSDDQKKNLLIPLDLLLMEYGLKVLCHVGLNLNFVMVSKLIQTVGFMSQPISEVSVCPYPFYSFSINPEGTASLCFLDWGRKLLIGDVNKQSVKEIWEGDQMRKYRLMFLNGDRKSHPVCGGCGQMTHGQPDNIDQYADELIKRF